MSTCKGRKNGGKFCGEQIDEDNEYCEQHSYFKDYTEEMFENLIKCIRCANMHFKTNLSQCPKCTDDSKIKNAKASSKKIHCSGIDRNRNQCREKVLHQGDFCSKHKYLKDYTEHMMKNLKLCSTCHKCFYSETFNTCEICRKERPKMNKERRAELPKCQIDYCNNIASESGYCGKHYDTKKEQTLKIKETLQKENPEHHICSNRDCHNLIPNNDSKKTCNECRERDKKLSNERRNQRIKYNQKHPNDMICVKCNKKIGIGFEYEKGYRSQKCEVCFKKQQEIEINRPERVERSEEKKKDIDEHIRYYKKRVYDTKGRITWGEDMTYKLCKQLMTGQCYYCGEKFEDNGYLLGIDRVDNTIGYCESNCVTCCTTCNYMKGIHTQQDFIKMCQHILCYNRIIDNYDFYPELFSGRTDICSFGKYINGINGHHIFELTRDEFYTLRKTACYICGRLNIDTRINSIDRLCSEIPYVLANCNSCCKTCNYLKRESNIGSFFAQLIKIADYTIDKNVLKVDESLSPEEYNLQKHEKSINIIKNIQFIKNKLELLKIIDKDLIRMEKDLSRDEKHSLNMKWYNECEQQTHEIRVEHKEKQQKEYKQKIREEIKQTLGEDKLRKMRRIEKAKQLNRKCDSDGHLIKTKIAMTSAERARLCRLRKKQIKVV